MTELGKHIIDLSSEETINALQSRIAAAFVNELENYAKNIVGRNSVYDYRNEIANNAAKKFLMSLCI